MCVAKCSVRKKETLCWEICLRKISFLFCLFHYLSLEAAMGWVAIVSLRCHFCLVVCDCGLKSLTCEAKKISALSFMCGRYFFPLIRKLNSTMRVCACVHVLYKWYNAWIWKALTCSLFTQDQVLQSFSLCDWRSFLNEYKYKPNFIEKTGIWEARGYLSELVFLYLL